MSVRDALQNYLRSVMQITGADAASLCLASELDRQTFFLLHGGNLSPLPELDGVKSAAEHYAEMMSDPFAGTASDEPVVRFQPSSVAGGYLLGIDIHRMRLVSAKKEASSQPDRRSEGQSGLVISDVNHGMIWLGLRYDAASKPDFVSKCGNSLKAFSTKHPMSADEGAIWTLALGGYMAWEAHRLSLLQQDSISQLPGRIEFQACLRREYEKAAREHHSLGLILVNPDEFGLINHRLGQQTGDAALREVAERLSGNLRRSDQVFRYGGAVFVVIMPTAGLSVVNTLAEKLRQTLTQHAYVNGAAHFAFSIGAAVCEDCAGDGASTAGPTELLHQADQALNVAKLSGGARTVCWHTDGIQQGIGHLDRLSGIFTADTEKDYRNMLLLWDTITVISSRLEREAIAREFVDRVGSTFKPDKVALFVNQGAEKLQLLAANRLQPNNLERVSDRLELSISIDQKKLLNDAQQHRRTERLRFEGGRAGLVSNGGKPSIAYAIPLQARNECLGSLYLEGPEEVLKLDTSDLIFLDALASQIGVALDRAALIYRWKQEKERESERLRQEVQELRQAIQHGRLVYRSSQMEGVLDTLRKVAPTDVTVLISGESGTGKEMLARTLHDLSARQDRAFVTIDCGAIAQSLMDTELFGHVKGAYTGAQGSAPGRIMQADGGTIFLDEIGEVPLEIQSKLLRFLQEKEITPVGGVQPVSVDVRIVAATNRDLANEVAKGRFRSDLYYRLQVVTVIAPPLRERPDDILPLAEHFLERFAKDYGKNTLSLDQSAETALLDYSWPGNVRELQHRILQAVVMSDKDEIGWGDLRLPINTSPQAKGQSILPPAEEPVSIPSNRGVTEPALTVTGANQSGNNPWIVLREALKHQVSSVLATDGVSVPLGRWLADDLVLIADQEANSTASRASTALGMAETTFRRRLEKVKREYQAGLIVRSSDWSALPPILTNLITSKHSSIGEKLFERARWVLLEEVVARVHQDSARGSALMGVTTPTYRRWTSSLQD